MSDINILDKCMDNIHSLMIEEDAKSEDPVDYYNHWYASRGHVFKGHLDAYIVAKLLGFISIELTIPNNRRQNYLLERDADELA